MRACAFRVYAPGDRQNTARRTDVADALGLVAGTVPATPLKYSVSLAPGQYAQLDDLVGAERRPNVPGTIDQHPNWRIPLPVSLDDLADTPLADRIVDVLRGPHS